MNFSTILKRGVILLGLILVIFLLEGGFGFAKDKDKDKTPPVISDLHVNNIAEDSVLIVWTTDELASFSIRYGIDSVNTNGPEDDEFAMTRSVTLSELATTTEYVYCISVADEDNNKTEECASFTTSAPPPPLPPPPSPSVSGGGGSRGSFARISGFAYPNAEIIVTLKSVPPKYSYEKKQIADVDALFSIDFKHFPSWFYVLSVTAVDSFGRKSVQKGYGFDFRSGDQPLLRDGIVIPPTISFAKKAIGWGEDILLRGVSMPSSGVVVEVGDLIYRVESDENGLYELIVDSTKFPPGDIYARARSERESDFGQGYSVLISAMIIPSAVPEADLNRDGVVNIKDVSIFLVHPVDLNKDEKVDIADLSIFLHMIGI